MKLSEQAAWLRIGIDAWALGWQAAHVMGLRSARIAAGGPAGAAEAWRMMAEKWQAAAELQADLLARSGASPATATRRTLAHYQRKVAANGRRLR